MYFVGSQRLSTAQYYELLERLSGTAMPKARVPVSVAAAWAAAGSFMGRRLTGRAPQVGAARVHVCDACGVLPGRPL